MDKPLLVYRDAERAIADPVIAKLHQELIKLDLVQFDSGYAGLMQGARLSANS